MRNRSSGVKTPPPRPAAEAAANVAEAPAADLSVPGGVAGARKTGPDAPIDIARDLELLHTMCSKLQLDDSMRAKVEDSLMEARVACALTQPDRAAVGDALNRGLKTARRAEDFEAAAPALRPHVQRAVAWLGTEWQRILAVVQ